MIARVRELELAEQQRHHDRGGASRGSESEVARELAVPLTGHLLDELLLERKQPLRAPIEAQPGLGRLDPATGAVEQLRPQTLLERADLQRDGGLGDPEPLSRLREALPLDDGAERRQLPRVHKHIL